MVEYKPQAENVIPSLSLSAWELLNGMPAGIMVVDAERKLLFANRWLAERVGLSAEQLIHTPLDRFLSDTGAALAASELHKLFAMGQPVTWEAALRTPDDTQLLIRFAAQPILDQGAIAAAQVSCLDVTAYRQSLADAERYRRDLEHQRQEVAALYSIGVSCALHMDLEEVLRLIYVNVEALFHFTTFAILLYDPASRQLSAALAVRDGEILPPRRWSLDEDEGLVGYAIRSSRPVLVRNWPQEADQYPIGQDPFADPDTRSWLSVPLGAGGAGRLGASGAGRLDGKEQVLGIIALQHRQADAFDENDQRSLYAIADQATMVIDNARLHQQTEQQLRDLQQANLEMQALQDLSRVLQSSLDLRNVLNFIVSGVATWLKYSLAVLALVDERSHTLSVRALSPRSAQGQDKTYPNWGEYASHFARVVWDLQHQGHEGPQSLVVLAAREAKILTSRSLHDLFRPHISPQIADQIQQELGVRNLVTVPLLSRNRLVGSLIVGMAHQEISSREIALLSAFAGQSAIAIENAQFYEAQRRRVLQLEVIRDFGQQIISFLDPDQLLFRAIQLLQERFDNCRVTLFLRRGPDTVEALEAGETGLLHSSRFSGSFAEHDLVSWTALHGQGSFVNHIQPPDGEQVRSELAVPIALGEQMLGVLYICQLGQTGPSYSSQAAHAFDRSDLFVLESLANQLAVALSNARLYDRANQQLAEVSTLYMLSEQIASSLETGVVLDRVVNVLKRVLNCRGCVIFLLDEAKEWLEIQVSTGIKPQWQREARFRLGEGLSGQVAQTGRPIYLPDTHAAPDVIMFDPAVRSLLVVPLIYKGEVIGTLNVDDDKPDAFSEDVNRLLSIAASQAAAAIANARLFEALRERAEKLAQAHRELQESDRLRAEFVQNMSHELRTPLTFIKGYVDVMLEGTLGPLNDQQRDSLQVVAERTERVIGLVNEILTFQQIEQGDFTFGLVSLADIAHAEVRSARAIAHQEGIQLVEDYAPDLAPVWGDRRRLERVFANLLGNAIKFMPLGASGACRSGGTITVRLRNQDDYVQADVIDQGIGIAQDQLGKIFERFYQVDGSSKRRFGGTGLGLTIVKEIVAAHGGEITVLSELGVGSTFRFTIPAQLPCTRHPPVETLH